MSNVKIGGTLYIRCRDCKLLKRPSIKDLSYGFLVLQPGTPVIWLGAAPEDKDFHKIQHKGQIAYTLFQNLSTKPFAEWSLFCQKCNGTGKVEVSWGHSRGFIDCSLCSGTGGWGKSMDSQSFASSSGIATKG